MANQLRKIKRQMKRKQQHGRRCPNCGELLPGRALDLSGNRQEYFSDCKSVIDLINSRIARYAGR